MKIAIISDIHGNYSAYNKAKDIISNMDVDHIFFLGDMFGYYYEGLRIFRDLITMDNVTMILGNHDQFFVEAYKTNEQIEIHEYIQKYGSSIKNFLSDVTEDEIVLLNSIPSQKDLTIDEIQFRLIHGGPEDSLNQRLYPDSDLNPTWCEHSDMLILGHTHYRMLKKMEQKVVLNPGSLGQPRDGLPPSFAVLDTRTKEVTFIDVEFDTTSLIKTILEKQSEPTYLIEVLNRWNRK
jgi:putative phosphoesterase